MHLVSLNDRVLLSKVKSLTLRTDEWTSHRRVEAIPQLTCVGGGACSLYNVDVMRCENSGSGFDNEDIQWTCKASLPPEFKLGSTDVICEGYNSPDDPYVLKGSCGVEYRLVLTDLGEEKYGKGRSSSRRPKNDEDYEFFGRKGATYANMFFNVLFWGVFLLVVGIFVYRIFIEPNLHRRPGGNGPLGWLGGGGGGGCGGGGGPSDDNDDPPPPYMPRAPKSASSYRANRAPTTNFQSSTQGTNNAWRPGFWTGAAAGAAGSYAANSWMNSRNAQRSAADRVLNSYPSDAEPGPSRRPPPSPSWFDSTPRGGSGSYYGGGPSNFGGSFPPPSSSRNESTGFGGTRRR
ncbi:hypothetical protein BAUCODRAFT_121963 [Baudoinia panamericana UAMH 10762]|uniref:Store-operated calcium entry-associated regulatory factor n=1 Tax=Baudoinia panamericana (strain UAMH 10762) TaxID=717646 RepID=M2NE84_BAUPA|nr:uncharacterized protein BAUCODRAFT_121963 [Baudoinia panamericana UAMH 10762]EMC97524.1 hypothetical protein BAUCODRAFT_121963 [Baudoinia panamericana UAMH 10762]